MAVNGAGIPTNNFHKTNIQSLMEQNVFTIVGFHVGINSKLIHTNQEGNNFLQHVLVANTYNYKTFDHSRTINFVSLGLSQ